MATVSSSLLCPRLTSVATSTPLSRRLARGHRHRSLRVRRVTFLPYTRRLYARSDPTTSGLSLLALSPTHRTPRMRFVFLGPGVCLLLPSDPESSRTPLQFGQEFLSSRPPSGLSPDKSLPGSLSLTSHPASGHDAARQAGRTKKKERAPTANGSSLFRFVLNAWRYWKSLKGNPGTADRSGRRASGHYHSCQRVRPGRRFRGRGKP